MSSEKSPLLDLPANVSVPGPATGHGETRRAFTLTIFALLGCYGYFHGGGQPNPVVAPFTESTVASGIAWWVCPDATAMECAYLTVPRDYANPKANDTVSIFLRKVPSTVPRKDRLGSILINPGGPGGSGSGFAASYGSQLAALVDGRYDIIGFDPRGVNMTIPSLDCYESEAQGVHSVYKQLLLGMPYDARGPNELSYEAREVSERLHMIKLNALYNATSLACQTQGNKQMLESVSTALVVQDMERIVDALGEDGLNFWGFSYGTILGSTFAAMRPHLVKRMVLDGVADAELYHRDIYQGSANSLVNTQKTLSGFFDACANAGPNRCAFAKSRNGKIPTSADLQSRLENLFERLRRQPMPVACSKTGPGILTASTAQLLVFTAMYAPITWPGLAKSIADAEAGDPQPMYDSIFTGYAELVPKKGDENPFNRRIERRATPANTASIMCGDTEPTGSKSLDDHIDFLHKLYEITPIGEWWSMWPGTCRNWNIRPIQRYDGPWSVEDGLKMTRFPILYASLDADPVTPLPAAQKMVNAFGNKSAALLVQEGFGHSTLAHPSLCSAKTFRKYFLYGELPSPGTLCKPEKGFLFPGNGTKQVSNLSMEDKKLWRALERLSETSQYFFRLS